MQVGLVVSDTWHFFQEIAEHLQSCMDVSIFSERVHRLPFLNTKINRWQLHHDLNRLMSSVDVAYFEWASIYLVAASHLPKRCPIVTRLHQYELYHWADQINWEHVDKVILVSTGMQQAFRERLPAHAAKTVVIPGGIRLDNFRAPSRPFAGAVGTLCHLEPRKRVYELILLFAQLLMRAPALHLYIGGDETPRQRDYYRAMHHLVAQLNLQSRVHFDGLITDPATWYRKIDMFVSNSYAEGLQVAPMEAIASGCYAVSHRWEGCDDLFPIEDTFVTQAEFEAVMLNYLSAAPDTRTLQRQRQLARVTEICDMRRVSQQIADVLVQTASEVA